MENSRFKFRAWDKSQNKMYQVRGINFDNEDLWLKINETQIMGANLFEVELMQYTGLKDKNGTEIYEGDIVEVIFDGKLRIFQVVFDLSELDFKATNGTEHYGNNFEYLTCCDEVRIIGNIFENPELLKEGD